MVGYGVLPEIVELGLCKEDTLGCGHFCYQ